MFLLPLTASVILLGFTFDLRSYDFKKEAVYDSDDVQHLTQITEINEFSAEYRLIESEVEFRKFLGLDITTNLKALVNEYPYPYRDDLKYYVNALTAKEVHMALKLSLRSVNETIPYDAMQRTGWGLINSSDIGTHYVKSIIYGSEIILFLSIRTKNSDHRAEIRRAILSRVGRSGTLDESFRDKFQAILEEYDTGYYKNGFGTVPYYTDKIPPRNIDQILELKENLSEIMKLLNDGKGAKLFYEMQSLSLLSPIAPAIDINNEIVEKLDDIEMKYEDLRYATDDLEMWLDKLPSDVSDEDLEKIGEFYEELEQANTDMESALRKMDVSTLGSINQFSKAMSSYGNTTDNRKYRRKVELIRQQYPTE